MNTFNGKVKAKRIEYSWEREPIAQALIDIESEFSKQLELGLMQRIAGIERGGGKSPSTWFRMYEGAEAISTKNISAQCCKCGNVDNLAVDIFPFDLYKGDNSHVDHLELPDDFKVNPLKHVDFVCDRAFDRLFDIDRVGVQPGHWEAEIKDVKVEIFGKMRIQLTVVTK